MAVIAAYQKGMMKLKKMVDEGGASSGSGGGGKDAGVNIAPRWHENSIAGCRCSRFRRFYLWLLRSNSTLPLLKGSSSVLFPCALPYPGALRVAGGELDKPGDSTLAAKQRVNALFAWCNFVTLGCRVLRRSTSRRHMGVLLNRLASLRMTCWATLHFLAATQHRARNRLLVLVQQFCPA